MTMKPKSTESKPATRRAAPRKRTGTAKTAAPPKKAREAPAAAETIEAPAAAETIEAPATPPSETIEAPVTPPKRRSGGGTTRAFLLTVVGMAFIGGAVYATEPVWFPVLGSYLSKAAKDPFLDPRMTGMDDRVGALESLAKARADTGDNIADLERQRRLSSERLVDLIEQVDGLEVALESVKKMIAATTLPAVAESTSESLRRFNERLEGLEGAGNALDGVTSRLSKLESDVVAGDAKSVDVKELEARNSELSAAVNRLAQRLNSLVVSGATRDHAAATQAPAVVLAVGQLRAALRTSGPFAKELAAVEAVVGKDPDAAKAIAELRRHAATGIETLESLRRRFNDTASAIVRTSLGGEGAGWRDWAGRWLTSLVMVRRTAVSATDDGTEAAVAQAEALLQAGDLIAVVQVLGALEGQAAAAADVWLTDARARLAAERDVARLHIFAISLLDSS
ncbi:MAG: mitofilin family membrane protein [Rhodospirillales bacterium]|nr:mitofilin family membrane protein [Rhodospirillales bacterium]